MCHAMIDNLINMLFRCGHRRLSPPITPAGMGTYMRCLDCGKALAFDMREMKLGKVLAESGAAAVRRAP